MKIETNSDTEIVKLNPYKAWPMVMAILLLTAWLVRLEAKVDNADARFANYKTSRETELKTISTKLDAISQSVGDARESVARIEGQLSAGKK